MSDITASSDVASNDGESSMGGSRDVNSEDDENDTSSDYRTDMLETLDSIGHGSFAASGSLPDVNPGLYVEGLGKIGLPLSERESVALAHVCHEAPFGKGSETFVDTTVRKTWQIDPDKIQFRNSKWPHQVNHAVSKITEGLGIIGGTGTVRAELHKLLLYEPGAFFDTHRDTEKAPGMIATMVLSLPSEHTGGDVDLRLNNQKMTIQTQDAGEFGMKYLAWYADVNHAVKPVVSGHRLVLTYNLIREGSNRSTVIPPSVQFSPATKLELAIRKWQAETNRSGELIHMLEHQYSEANFGLHSLKGKDQLRASHLIDAAKKHDVYVYFAHFQHTVSGGVDECDPYDRYKDVEVHDIMDEYDSDWKLLTLFTSDGCKIAEGLDLDPENFIEDVCLEDEGPDFEDFEGWTGNEGANTTHYYRRSCIVMFSKEWRHEILATAAFVALDKWAKLAFHDLNQAKRSPTPSLVAELSAISTKVQESRYSNVADTDPAVFVDLALRLKQPSLLKAAIGRGLELETCRRLGSSGIRLLDKDWLLELQTALTNAPSGTKRLEAINALVTAVRDASRTDADRAEATDLEQALVRTLPKTWNYKHDETVGDANRLVSLCTNTREDLIRETLLPIAKKSTNITFLQTLAYNMAAKVRTGEVSSEAARSFVDQVLANLASSIRRCCPFLDHDQNAERLREGDSSEMLSWTWGSRDQMFSAQKFATLVKACETVKSSSSVNKMLGILTDISRKPNQLAFSDFLLPVLAGLPPQSVNGGLKLYMDLFRSVIFSYTNQFVPTHARRIQDWSLPKRGCSSGCTDCKDLDRFLTDIHRYATEFAIATPRRKHLEQRLSGSGLNVSTDTRSKRVFKLVVRKTRSVLRDDTDTLQKTRQNAANDIFRIGKDKLRSMLGEERYGKLHTALGIPYTQVPDLNDAGPARTPLADAPFTTANTQGNKRAHDQAFDDKSDPSKRTKQCAEVIDLEADD